MTHSNQAAQLRIGKDYRNHLLVQVELLRCAISHEELGERLGVVTERYLARYIAGKAHLRKDEVEKIAEALTIDAQILTSAWATSLGLRPPAKDVVNWMVDRAYRHWRRHSPLAAFRVPPNPSPMTVIRVKYADRLPQETPPLWFNSFGDTRPTREGHERFARAYEMLVEFVHAHQSQRNVGAMHGLSGMRAAQLMGRAACTWAKSEGIDLFDKSVPFKNDRKLIKNLYAGLRFFAQRQFDALAAGDDAERDVEGSTRWHC
jgi:transcriptional regulator with XRE-family HTH domain